VGRYRTRERAPCHLRIPPSSSARSLVRRRTKRRAPRVNEIHRRRSQTAEESTASRARVGNQKLRACLSASRAEIKISQHSAVRIKFARFHARIFDRRFPFPGKGKRINDEMLIDIDTEYEIRNSTIKRIRCVLRIFFIDTNAWLVFGSFAGSRVLASSRVNRYD